MLGSLVSNVAYSTAVKIAAIVSIFLMAFQNNLEAQYGNDVWYSATIAVIVIGPHALERLASNPDEHSASSRAVRAFVPLVPLLGFFFALARFAV